jgi:GNAT superfamily N-acetyltransferase
MPDFSIRAATVQDLAGIHAVWYATETVGEADPPPLGQPHPWLRHVLRTGTLLVAERDGAVIGFAGVIARGELVFLTDLFVAPQTQSHGVGAALLGAILPHDGRTLATIGSSDPRAQALYIRAGMTPEWPDFQIWVERERWRPPELDLRGVEMVIAAPLEADLLAFDAEIGGRQRPEEHRYWLEDCAGRLSCSSARGAMWDMAMRVWLPRRRCSLPIPPSSARLAGAMRRMRHHACWPLSPGP